MILNTPSIFNINNIVKEILNDEYLKDKISKYGSLLVFNSFDHTGIKEIITYANFNICKFKLFLRLNYEKIHSVKLLEEKLIISYNNGSKNSNRYRENYFRNINSLIKDLIDFGFPFFEYSKFDSYIFRSVDYTEIHGVASFKTCNYREVALFEYIERIASFKCNKSKVGTTKVIFRDSNMAKTGFNWLKKINKVNLSQYIDYMVIGFDLYSNEKVIIPRSYIYYNSDCDNLSIPKYIRGSSNGIAVGNSLKEALLFSMLEMYERDTFQRYWHFDEFPSFLLTTKYLNFSVELSRDITILELKGYDVSFINIERDSILITIWCIIRSFNQENLIFSCSGLAAGFDLNEVIKKSFYEAFNSFNSLENNTNFKNKINHLNINQNKNESSSPLEKIQLYYSSYNIKDKVDNIINNTKIYDKKITRYEKKLEYDALFNYFQKLYKNVYMHNMTPDFCYKHNLYCVKTFSPNAFDMYYNYLDIRSDGLLYIPIA